MPEYSKQQRRSTRRAPIDMLAPAGGPLRARGRDNHLTEFREFQDGELIVGTRYRVVRLIGVGGMGSVYEVEHVELGKRFVLKALLRELARREDLAARLRNEWRALARLQHPNIVNVTDAGTSGGGVPYYVMERLDGSTLAGHLKQRRRLHVLEAVAISTQVLEALSAAHDIGIIHRDVKPANIFLVGGGSSVKLLDFGVAKIADATSVVTARGLAVGTPRYMSPEQARGERVDGRSDVYATGLILFEMIAGVGPYDDARDANELLLAHLAREAPPLSSLVMGVAPELERILTSMLAKDIRQRPAHARVVAGQLRDFAARQHRVPATDAPTVAAPYGAVTVVAPNAANLGPRHELPTRPDGVAQGASGVDPSGSDAAVTRPVAAQVTTQVTLTVNTHESLITTSASPNTTYISAPPSFDGSTTLEMATLVPAYAPTRQSYPPVERPERTEMLGELPPVPLDAVPTRTHVPLVDLGRPISLTPPPVVDAGRSPVATAPSARLARFGAVAAGGLAILAVATVAVRRHGAAEHVPANSNAVAAATSVARPAPLPVATAPLASAEPTRPSPSAASALATAGEPTQPSATVAPLVKAPGLLATAHDSSIIPSTKPPAPATGPFLRGVPPVALIPGAKKPKAKRVLPGMPASGL